MDWFPWYFTLYESDTMHLNPYQDGCYRRLIDHYMKTRQALPDNDAALARIIGDSEANWLALASTLVRSFFKPKNGRLYLFRCEEILHYQEQKTKKLSESGKKGALSRNNKIKELLSTPEATLKPTLSTGHVQVDIQVDKKEKESLPDSLVIIDSLWAQLDSSAEAKPKNKSEKSKKGTRLPPEWIVPDEWGDWAVEYCSKNGLMDGTRFVIEQGQIFKNYWTAKTGAGSTKMDWKATWENWIRKGLPDYIYKLKRMEREKSYEQIRKRN
jgi:uncharacterized protein YdaU (DUF1376 family)